MSDRDNDDLPDAPTKVGYGKPPAQHRFKTGQSGNPRKARVAAALPALTDSLAADLVLLGEAYRFIQLHQAGVPTTLSTVSAVYRSMAVAAVKGNRFAQRTFTGRVRQAEARRRDQTMEAIDIASNFKKNWSAAFQEADRHGVPRPTVLPHPDDILEGRDGMPYVVGPATKPEARHWAKLQTRATEADAAIRDCQAELNKRSRQKYESFNFDEIVYEHRLRVMLRYSAPTPDTRRTLHYRRPTAAEMRAFHETTKTRYRLFAELPRPSEKPSFWRSSAMTGHSSRPCHEL